MPVLLLPCRGLVLVGVPVVKVSVAGVSLLGIISACAIDPRLIPSPSEIVAIATTHHLLPFLYILKCFFITILSQKVIT